MTNKTVLIVDDYSALGRNIVRALSTMDFEVVIIDRPTAITTDKKYESIIIGAGQQNPLNLNNLVKHRKLVEPLSNLSYCDPFYERGGKQKKGGNHRYPIRTKLNGFHKGK